MSIISREMAEAMHMSAAERQRERERDVCYKVSHSQCKVALVEAHSVPNQISEIRALMCSADLGEQKFCAEDK